MRRIMYLRDDRGNVISRVGSEVAWPILDYDKMLPENNFATQYHLEKVDVLDVCRELGAYKGTRKLPVAVKNEHRRFWGMTPLAE